MKKTIIFVLFLFALSTLTRAALTPQEVINKFNDQFLKIKDAQANVILDAGLQMLGCSGLQRWQGKGYYQFPDKLKIILNGDTFIARGNKIRKIDREGKRYYIRLINALDLDVGFIPRLISRNFNLSLTKETTEEIVVEGVPKSGILKNAKKIYFYFDPRTFLLRKFFVVFENKKLSGRIDIDYQLIGQIWVPAGFHGRTAVEIARNALVGMVIRVTSKNVVINQGLPALTFDPGF